MYRLLVVCCWLFVRNTRPQITNNKPLALTPFHQIQGLLVSPTPQEKMTFVGWAFIARPLLFLQEI